MKLTDLVDRSQLQEIQDRLSTVTGLPMGMVDTDGNDITERSGLSHFCELLLGTEKGLKKCIEATKENIATKPGKVNSYECYAGLWHLNTPIAIEDEVIGIIVIGNMLREKLGKGHVEQLAEEYGLDKGELWEASKDLRMYNEEEAENVVQLLATISSTLSKQASYAAKLREYSEQLEEKVEKKIQEVVHQKEMIENITRSIDEGILLLSKDFKILWANRKIMDMTGLEESDVIGDYCFRVTHHLEEPCKAPHDTCPVKEVIKTGKPVAKTHTHFDKDGNEFYAEVIAYPLRDEKGEITGFAHVARDITERKKMEEALRESEQKTRTTMDNIAMGVSMISPKMEIVWLNRTFKEWFPEIKVERKPLCYRSFYYPPKKGICDYCPTIKAFEDGQVHSSETDACADGKIYFVTSAPVKNDEGETVCVIETVQDITERKRLEDQIIETKDHLKNVMDTIRERICAIDREFRIISFNESFARGVKFPRSKILGEKCYKVFHGYSDEDFLKFCKDICNVKKAFESGEPVESIHKHEEHGSLVYHESKALPTKDLDGEVYQVVYIVDDVTDRKRAEEKIRKLKDFSENIVKHAPLGIFTTDKNGVITSANPVHLKMMGETSVEQALGLNVLELPPIKARGWDKLFRKALQGEPFELYNEKYTSIYGKTVYLTARCTPLKDEKGDVGGLLVVMEDVTERARLEEEIRETKDFLDNIVEGSADSIVTTDLEGKITTWSRGAEEIFGYKAEDVIGRPVDELYPPELKKIRKKWQKRIMKGETIRNQRTKVYNSAGELVDINLTLSPLRDKDGRPMGTVGVAKDIRQVIKAEEEISVLSEIAKEVSKTVQLDKVFGAISKYLERIVPYDRATIALVDEESKEFYVAAIVTRRKAVVMKGARIPFSDAILTKVVENKREIIRSDLSKEEDLYPIDKKLQKEGVRSYLLVPLIVEGKAIGTLNFGSYQSNTYTEEHIRLAREVANLVSIAVDKSRLFEKLVKSELETKETKEYLGKLIETSPYCIISTDLEGRIVSFNKAAEETYGRKAEEVIGKHARILQPKEVPKELNKEIYEAMLKREGWGGELLNIRKNGEVFPTYLHTRRIVDERGNSIGLLSLAQDITERKKAEEEIKRLKEFNEDIVQSMREGILIEDPDGIITFVNPKTEELLGYSKEELVGKHWKDISSPEYIEKMREETAKRPKGISSSYEAAAVSKDGRTIPIIISATPIFEDGRYKGVLSVFTDITERKKMEEDLREYAKQLEHSNRIKDLFTDIMRHDLLTPICIIQNASELLLESNIFKGTTAEELQMLKRNVIKLQEMIDDATKYAKLESMGEFDFKERDISMIIEGVARDLKSFADEKGIVVENRIEGEHPAPVSPFIREVFSNLLSNAIKFSPKGGRVVIDMEDEGKNWKVAVKDNGGGVPDRYKESIFLRFERVTKEGVVGTGLGLAIVKRIVELHNGKVWIEDNPEGGSIFYVQLPKKREAA